MSDLVLGTFAEKVLVDIYKTKDVLVRSIPGVGLNNFIKELVKKITADKKIIVINIYQFRLYSFLY